MRVRKNMFAWDSGYGMVVIRQLLPKTHRFLSGLKVFDDLDTEHQRSLDQQVK